MSFLILTILVYDLLPAYALACDRCMLHISGRLQTEKEQLEKWFRAAKENADKVKDPTLLHEEDLNQR